MQRLVLGSSSKYRAALLQRLRLPFDCDKPELDESRLANESARDLVLRLSFEKAQAVAQRQPDALVIGSDQVAIRDEAILGKPGTQQNAFDQLRAASGREIRFLTGLCLFNAATGSKQIDIVETIVSFRELADEDIRSYIAADQPFDCAGSFKSEALGISLFKSVRSDDPTALEGLPLIRLCEFLRTESVDPFSRMRNAE